MKQRGHDFAVIEPLCCFSWKSEDALLRVSVRFNMLAKTRQTWRADGMNTVEYEVISREYLPLYTNITVNIGTEAGLHPPPRTPGPAPKAEAKDGAEKLKEK